MLDQVAQAGATFKSLADTWADTTTPHGRLILTVLGRLAEFERELIRARTGEGRARTLVDIARTYGVSHMTIARAVEGGPNPFAASAADVQ